MPFDPRVCSVTWVGRPLDPIVSVCLRSPLDDMSKANTDTAEPQGCCAWRGDRRADQGTRRDFGPKSIARRFLSREHHVAAELIMAWMRGACMRAHLDAIGNVCGRYEGERPGLPCLMLVSHYDTVRDAGKWDGPLV